MTSVYTVLSRLRHAQKHDAMSDIVERLLPHGGGHQTPTRIIVHCMAETTIYEGKQYKAWELLDFLGLSAHVLIPPDGSRIRCRHDDQIAWHAKGHNTNSLGVEVLVPDVFNLEQLQDKTRKPWVSDAQLNTLVQQIMIWKKEHRIEKLDRHSDVDPVRKWYDPGAGFDFTELLRRTWSC